MPSSVAVCVCGGGGEFGVIGIICFTKSNNCLWLYSLYFPRLVSVHSELVWENKGNKARQLFHLVKQLTVSEDESQPGCWSISKQWIGCHWLSFNFPWLAQFKFPLIGSVLISPFVVFFPPVEWQQMREESSSEEEGGGGGAPAGDPLPEVPQGPQVTGQWLNLTHSILQGNLWASN